MKKIDTLILGCTHYPLFQKIIKKEMGKRVEIINTGEKIARKLTTYLQENNIQNVEEMIEDKKRNDERSVSSFLFLLSCQLVKYRNTQKYSDC